MTKRPHFEIRLSKSIEFYFVLVAPNGEVICMSQMYDTIDGCEKGIRSVKRNALIARTDDMTKKK